jgi:hypothetical protein
MINIYSLFDGVLLSTASDHAPESERSDGAVVAAELRPMSEAVNKQ